MTTLLRVLLVEDSDSDAELTVRALERGGYELMFDRVDEPDAMRDALDARRWDLIITDWSMPRFSALGALAIARGKAAEVPVIVVSGTVGEETAIEALQAGAHDFVIKGKLTRLVPAVQRELREVEARARTETALRKAEEQLRQAQKMEAVGQLAGGIAHDFNNMLSVVLGYADLLLADLKADDPVREDIEEIRKAGLGASNLTRQLLAFSRRQVLQPTPLDIIRVVQGMENMLRRLLGANVELTVPVSHGLWALDGVWDHHPERRARLGVQRARRRDDLQDPPSANRRRAANGQLSATTLPVIGWIGDDSARRGRRAGPCRRPRDSSAPWLSRARGSQPGRRARRLRATQGPDPLASHRYRPAPHERIRAREEAGADAT
jgi:signal transduction histidine kinase